MRFVRRRQCWHFSGGHAHLFLSSPLLPSLPPSTSRTIFLSSFSPTFTFALPSVWPCSDRWREETLLPPPCVRSPVLWGLKDPKKPAATCVTDAKHARVFPDPESRPDLECEPDPDLSLSVAQCVLALLLLTTCFHQSLDCPTLITTTTAVVVCSALRKVSPPGDGYQLSPPGQMFPPSSSSVGRS